ncbi:MAG: hypothetical protein M5U34_34460 [Chloroflexi bacterium]|nr:hypothetical protein [Chloroflexota bacterium]
MGEGACQLSLLQPIICGVTAVLILLLFTTTSLLLRRQRKR